ncbi:hypothetical protein A2970_00930 [Candidatus Roizmanbacteria bacterium RIFCSPLOWO2_01_FULL_44_13]|uniref:Glycosyl transferase family 1 domain-containing protein n=1 Tax=Candidatus Roizmanbacteria bacterium RIFCSPLOWO2_01_FULL_44_13 TaxID=1802069 RepID=A0A1F7J9U1_9BACT|nr:MAG: hypothetical protein A2970_00930 [Candidatus Roizmanbacteria bacterium RIFCSPLOWO2_01_FULL_44_13]
MKKIGIDARLLRQTGVGTYLENLLHYLDRQKISDISFYVYLMSEDFDKTVFKNKKIIKRKADFRWHTIGEQLGFLWALYQDKLDLMHFTYFSYPFFYMRKFMATVHDVTLLNFKSGKASSKSELLYQIKYFFFKILFENQIRKAAKIITPTRTVKKQLVEIFGREIKKKTLPIYEGVDYRVLKEKENKKLEGKFEDFFIYVGNFYPHKNVERLIAAFSKLKKPSSLILMGPDDYFTKRLEPLVASKKNVHLIKNSPTSDLIFFYKNARALIHPSFSEGFGLPLVEAAHFGCPIIASNIPVFKELFGGSYISFNPYDVSDIARAIKVSFAKKTKPDYSQIMKKFSFQKMTRKTRNIYIELTK